MTTIDRDRLAIGGAGLRASGGATPELRAAPAWEWMEALADAAESDGAALDEPKSASGTSVQLWESIGNRLALGAFAALAESAPLHRAPERNEARQAKPAPVRQGEPEMQNAGHVAFPRGHSAMHVLCAMASGARGAVGVGTSTACECASAPTTRSAHSPSREWDPCREANVRRQPGDEAPWNSCLLPPPVAPLPAPLRRLMGRRGGVGDRAPNADRSGERSGLRRPETARSSMRWLRRVTHAFAGPGGITVWLRDGRLEAGHLRSIVCALSRWASTVGVTLAAVVCNGKVVYRDARSRDAAAAAGMPGPRSQY